MTALKATRETNVKGKNYQFPSFVTMFKGTIMLKIFFKILKRLKGYDIQVKK